jgi:hypothetical protein
VDVSTVKRSPVVSLNARVEYTAPRWVKWVFGCVILVLIAACCRLWQQSGTLSALESELVRVKQLEEVGLKAKDRLQNELEKAKKAGDELEKVVKECMSKGAILEKAGKECRGKLEKVDNECRDKLEKVENKSRGKLEKADSECRDKLEKVDNESRGKLEEAGKECWGKLEKGDKECRGKLEKVDKKCRAKEDEAQDLLKKLRDFEVDFKSRGAELERVDRECKQKMQEPSKGVYIYVLSLDMYYRHPAFMCHRYIRRCCWWRYAGLFATCTVTEDGQSQSHGINQLKKREGCL